MVAAVRLLPLLLAALARAAPPPPPAGPPPADKAVEAPEAAEAALASDDACSASEGGADGDCGLALRQLRGQAKASEADHALAAAGGEQEVRSAGADQVLAADGEEDAEKAAADANETLSGSRQVPAWWWKYYYHPHYAPNYHKPTPVQHHSLPADYYGNGQPVTIYMYRSKGAKNFEDTNVNMANLAGVTWYLHNEVVPFCPRKFKIMRIIRYKVTLKGTSQVVAASRGSPFAHLCHFDSGRCTGPGLSIKDYDRYGYVVGCDRPSTHVGAYKQATWYSMPGNCPTMTFKSKSRYPSCKYSRPGGECKPGEAWSKTCTWRKEYAGEVTLEELTGVRADGSWCRRGNIEYKKSCDCGRGTSYWNGKHDWAACSRRVDHLRDTFAKKYPNMPADLGEARCPFGDKNR